MMKLTEFNYELPKELIAQEPLKERDSARLMVVERDEESILKRSFRDIKDYLREGDCLVLNDTRVIPARLYGKRRTGGKVEIFLLNAGLDEQRALIRPSKKIKEGEEIELENGCMAEVMGIADVGRFVRFNAPLDEVLKGGHVPLPPYITRADTSLDKEDYQTVYGSAEGATAAPTAGLHFTADLLEEIRESGVKTAFVTLHTSYGTFAPVKEEIIEEHVMHEEYFKIGDEAAAVINDTIRAGGRIFAVGTTSTRVLESAATSERSVSPRHGKTNLFIYPGYKFKIISGLITNFHLPESTLLMLISAFAGRDLVMEAYKKAIDEKFRFFSYGDAMLIV